MPPFEAKAMSGSNGDLEGMKYVLFVRLIPRRPFEEDTSHCDVLTVAQLKINICVL